MRLTTRLLNITGEVTATLAVGHWLKGKVGSYKVLEHFTKDRDVWKAIDENARQVVIKRAPPHLLNIEREILEIVKNRTCIRQMIDNIENPSTLVLEYLNDNLLDVCSRKRLESPELKVVARTVLEALALLHEKGFVHTGQYPWFITLSTAVLRLYVTQMLSPTTFSSIMVVTFGRIALGDCGDAYRFNSSGDPLEEIHVIGATIFRSPEAQLNLRWGPPTDIWSLGATLISLIFGGNWHIFSPANVSFDDEHYGFWVLVEQIRRFGPVYNSFREIADAERVEICAGATVYIQENQKWLPFSMSGDDELAQPDRDFIVKMMKLDPRDRPTARELLQDAWFKS